MLLTTGLPLPTLAIAQRFSDIADHWAKQDIEKAVTAGWVDGYPDGTFRPDKNITRAEFVKMLSAAIHLTPDSETSKLLIQQNAYILERQPEDLKGHWLSKQGWAQPALAFGLIIPTDYKNNKFEPDRPITRLEIAIMAVRALGLVYPATQAGINKLPFTDQDQIPKSEQGYVQQTVNAGVITGYPNGTFGGNRQATRAEAITMILRVLQWMETGVDTEIKVFVRRPPEYYPDDTPQAVDLVVPAQMIDKRIYVPVRCVYEAVDKKLYHGSGIHPNWDPNRQILSFEYGAMVMFPAGDDRYGFYDLNQYFPAKTRLLYGELMVPAYDPDQPSLMNLWSAPTWDSATKTLILTVNEAKTGE